MTSQAMVLKQCPLTCGLATRMTEDGFNRACLAKLEQMSKLAAVNSTNPHAAFCRECRGRNRPAELEIISKEEIMERPMPSGEKPYVMPQELAAILRPMSLIEAEGATIGGLVKFWRRPLIRHTGPSACPCCGGVHRLKNSGICSGCNSDKVAKLNLSGIQLLEHLAKRAKGGKKKTALPEKKNKKSTIPVPCPPSPAAQLGEINEATDRVAELTEKLATLKRKTCEDILGIIGIGNGSALSAQDDEADLAAITAGFIRESITEGTWRADSIEGSTEEAIVAKWSSLPLPVGYESLADVLHEAIAQAAIGKGLERHADDRPFHDQPILRETQAVGLGFPAGQARKKILEAVRCCQDQPERAVADLLGAINYTAALVIAIRAGMVGQTA